MQGTISDNKDAKMNMASMHLRIQEMGYYRQLTVAQSVMFYNVNVRTQGRGAHPDLVLRESFLEEVTCKLTPES